MRRWLGPLLGALLFFTGCARPEPSPVRQNKSCEALLFEREATERSLAELEAQPEFHRGGWDRFHLGVVAAGVVVSLQPVWLLSNHFYVPPAVTIGYYNAFVRSDDRGERMERLGEQKALLERLIEEKDCQN